MQREKPGSSDADRFTASRGCVSSADQPPAASDDAQRQSAGGSHGIPPSRILLVEDHSDTAFLFERLLQKRGHQVKVAADVSSAITFLNERSFHLLVSDLGLPDGTGIELLSRARRIQPGLPAIALSGYGMEEDLSRSLEAGFDAHLTKPVDLDSLEAAIARILRSGR